MGPSAEEVMRSVDATAALPCAHRREPPDSHEFGWRLARQEVSHYARLMSRRSDTVAAETCVALGATMRASRPIEPRTPFGISGDLASTPSQTETARRTLVFPRPLRSADLQQGKPMDVAPHPHIGLQTVTWLLQGEVVHDDSLGYESILRPGGVNVMTSGTLSLTRNRRQGTIQAN